MAKDAFVEVTGYGSVTTTPDVVCLQVAAVAREPGVRDAFATADSALKAMLAAARDHDVPDADLRSTHIDVRAGRRGRGKGPGFRVSMGVEVTVRDVTAAGGALAAIMDAGGDAGRVQRVSFASAAPEEALAEARTAAWANAVDRARQYARLSGRDLGAVLQVTEGPSIPRYARQAYAGVADAASVSLEPGSQTVTATINTRWALL